QRRNVDAGEGQGQAAQPAVQVEDPVGPDRGAEDLRRQGQAPQHRRRQQGPGHQTGGPGDVPGELTAHRNLLGGGTQPVTSTPSTPTLGVPAAVSGSFLGSLCQPGGSGVSPEKISPQGSG